MSRIWVLVAESSRAKIYTTTSWTAPLTEVADFAHPEGRLHEGDLVSDTAGSDGGSVGQGRHVIDDKTSAKEQVAIDFSKQLAGYLEAARIKGDFNKLVLMAPAAFLGLLRSNLSKPTMSMVTQQVDKNLVQKPAETISEYL